DRHLALLSQLKPSHMSGDEAEVDSEDDSVKRQPHPRKYFIIGSAWQSKPLIEFFHTLDKWHLEDFKNGVGDQLPGGNAPRERLPHPDGRIDNTVAPRGLWRNCYDPDWLATLKPHVREQLRIIDEDYDFTL
ncbi:hypothetical protein C8Q76DRAFT_593952, partial [Earliella scabrosa]